MFVVSRATQRDPLSFLFSAADAILRPLCAKNCEAFFLFSGGKFHGEPVLSKLFYRKGTPWESDFLPQNVDLHCCFCDEFLFKIHSHTGSIMKKGGKGFLGADSWIIG